MNSFTVSHSKKECILLSKCNGFISFLVYNSAALSEVFLTYTKQLSFTAFVPDFDTFQLTILGDVMKITVSLCCLISVELLQLLKCVISSDFTYF